MNYFEKTQMEKFTPTPYKTVKITRIEHTLNRVQIKVVKNSK